jgi:hypothetical protein
MNHPINPPPELVRKWAQESPMESSSESWAYEMFIAYRAAQWGAALELEACCAWVDWKCSGPMARLLRSDRRHESPSLKEQALAELAEWENVMDIAPDSPIRRALDQLDD